MLNHFKPTSSPSSSSSSSSQNMEGNTKLMSEDDREDVYMSFQGKFINGKMKVGAVVRVLKPLSDDERAKTLRSVPIAQRETDAYRTRCRQKFWTLYFYEFHDTENLCNLESLLVRFSPKVCFYDLVGRAKSSEEKLLQLFQQLSIQKSTCKSANFKLEGIEDELNRLLVTAVEQYTNVVQWKIALGAASNLIKQINNHLDQGNYELVEGHLKQFVRLDTAAISALNLMPQKDDRNKFCSVYGILNHCQTPMGRRLLELWLRQPLIDVNAINQRQDIVECLYDDSELRDTLIQEKLKGLGDLEKIIYRLKNNKSSLRDLWSLRELALRLPHLRQTIERASLFEMDGSGGGNTEDEGKKAIMNSQFLNPLKSLENEFSTFIQFIEKAIDVEGFYDSGVLRVNPRVSKELMGLRNSMEEIDSKIEQYIQVDLPNALPKGMSQNDVKHDLPGKHHDGHSFRVAKKFEKHVKKIKGYRELKIVKAGVCFTTGKCMGLSSRWEYLQTQYKKESKKYLDQAINCAATYLPIIELSNLIISKLDVFTSLAHTACNALGGPYVRPNLKAVGQKGNIKIIRGRHPCLEAQDDVNFIPNNYELTREESRMLIITGPNMGGKSTYIRQLGIIAVMAQIGSFVPADIANLCVVDAVLARVGAGDAQLKGVSTFMAEMLEASAILTTATEDSLVIVDELGRGTSTNDGFGLAWAIAEKIVEKNALCMFATHFHELTSLADKIKGAKNLHATAMTTDNSITMKYEILPGACDRSFGIHVAELASFPEDVILNAKRKAQALEGSGSVNIDKKTWAPLLQEFAKMDLNGKDEMEIVNQLEALMNSDAGKSVFQQQVGNGGSNLP